MDFAKWSRVAAIRAGKAAPETCTCRQLTHQAWQADTRHTQGTAHKPADSASTLTTNILHKRDKRQRQLAGRPAELQRSCGGMQPCAHMRPGPLERQPAACTRCSRRCSPGAPSGASLPAWISTLSLVWLAYVHVVAQGGLWHLQAGTVKCIVTTGSPHWSVVPHSWVSGTAALWLHWRSSMLVSCPDESRYVTERCAWGIMHEVQCLPALAWWPAAAAGWLPAPSQPC